MPKDNRKKHNDEMRGLHNFYMQVLKDILTGMGFAESGTGLKASFIKGEIHVALLFDFRDLKLTLTMYKTTGEKRNLGTEHFWYSDELPKELENEFLPKLDEMLSTQGFILSTEGKQAAADKIVLFHVSLKKKKGFLAGLFGR